MLVALVATAVCATLTQAASQKRDLNTRHKRSFSWLPPFLGGGSSDAIPDEEASVVDENRIQNGGNPVPVVGPYPDASYAMKIVNNGRVIDNKLHYPIWRVHKYNGVHLQPLPVSLVHNPSAVPSVQEQTATEDIDDTLPSDIPSEVTTWLSPELIQMARQFGVKDFSNVPSLSEAMDALGTSTKDETIAAIKEFATTQDGRDLIRQFVEGQNAQDNEVAASENVDNVESAEKAESAENVENTENAKNAEDADDYASQIARAIENAGNANGYETYEGAPTMMIGQYLYPPLQTQLYSQLAGLSSGPPQTEKQSEAEAPEVETTTSASFFGRITQWANFLNPLTNREEIPIPAIESDINDTNTAPANLNDEHIRNQDTIAIPQLPELPPLPQLPGDENQLPPLPEIRIPNRYISPHAGNVNAQQTNGQYVRVKLPLAGFNPTPQYYIDPKYLQYARNQLNGQDVQIIPNVQQQYVVEQKPLPIYHRIGTTVNQQAQIAQPAFVNQPVQFVQEIPNLELPSFEAQPFGPAVALATPFRHIGQLPLVQTANYEVFRNAPRIVNSVGAPAPPYTYELNGSPNAFYVSPNSNAVYIQQEYEVPAASEIVERTINANGDDDNESQEAAKSANEQKMQIEVPGEDVEEEEEQAVERSNENDEITRAANHNDDHSEESKESKESQEPEQKAIDIDDENLNTEKKTDVEVKPSTEKTIYESLRPKMKVIKAQNEKRSVSNIQRITPHDNATGAVHRADPKAMEMLPFTVRHMVESTQTANDHQE